MSPDSCPNCGAAVPPRARACPACGADETTGWSEAARYSGLDLPEETFDYEDFLRREFGPPRGPPAPRGIKWFWGTVTVAVLVALLTLLLL